MTGVSGVRARKKKKKKKKERNEPQDTGAHLCSQQKQGDLWV
jgi:hypothetical protein